MGKNTKIQWCDHTWNPWQGCKKISPGCLNCYMFREKKKYGQNPNKVVRSAKHTFYAPLRWNKQIDGKYPSGKKELVFVCSWSDFLIEESDKWREEAMKIISKCENLAFLILTKRPERILSWGIRNPFKKFSNNIWLGVSVENDDYLHRFNYLQIIDVPIKFISYEPAIGPLNIESIIGDLDWVISGGESCSNRFTDVNWIRHVRDLCLEYDVPFFHKQNGGYHKIDGCYGGCELDGVVWHQYPKVYYR